MCSVCAGQIPTGGPAPVAPILCTDCVFWGDRVTSCAHAADNRIPNLYSIRSCGEHFTVDGRVEGGPVMTIDLPGFTIVTSRLRQQGPIPVRWKPLLPDNATIIEGNPKELPIGVHRS